MNFNERVATDAMGRFEEGLEHVEDDGQLRALIYRVILEAVEETVEAMY